MAYLKGMLGATFFVLIFFSSTLGQTLWFENFDGEADGATTGTAAGTPGGTWSRTYTGGGTFSRQSPLGLNIFMGQSMGSVEGRWATNVIDISAYGYAIIDLTTYSLFIDADGDYFTAYYILNNNGIEVPFYTQTGSIVGTGGSAIVSGSQLQVVVRMYNDDFFDTWGIEDLTVTGISTLYSTNAGGTSAWNQGTTWSTTGFGGAVCSCTPNNLTRVLIGSGYSINIPSAGDAIYLEVQSGGALTWSAAADLNIGRGGIYVQSSGSVSSGASTTAQIDFDGDIATPVVVDGALTIGDIDINGDITITMTGTGTVNVADDVLINNNVTLTSTLTSTIIIAGDLNVDVTSTIGGSSSIQTATLTINGGTTTFSTTGNLTVTGASSVAGTFLDNENTGVSTFSGLLTISGTWTSTAVSNASNLVFQNGISLGGTFNAAAATFNTNNQSLSGTSGTYNFSRIVVVTGVTLTNNRTVTFSNTGADRLQGTGTWIQGVNSTLNYASTNIAISSFQASNTGNTVNYNSSVTQVIRTPATNYYNLTLDNSAALPAFTLSGNITVTTTLNFTNGIVNLSGNTLTLGASGTASDLNRTASTTTRWMYGGSFTRFWPTGQTPSPTTGNLYGLFPLGAAAASSYRPVQITAGSNVTTTGSVTFTHNDNSGSTDLSPVYNDGGTNIVRKHNAQFIGAVTGVTGGTNYSISVTMTGLLTGTAGDIRLAVSNGTTTVTGVGASGGNTGTATNPVVSRTGLSVTNLSNDFRITTTNSTATPLPIELVKFTAEQMGDEVFLQWTTATELNNDFFTIHKLNDNDGFDEVIRVKGQGTTKVEHNYSAFDANPKTGKNYYRLMQTDFDGQVSYSEIVAVNFEASGSALKVYPNPVKQTYFTVQLRNLLPGQKIPLSLRTPMGVTLTQSDLTADEMGVVNVNVSTDQMTPGLYLLHLNVKGGLVRKIIIE